MSTRVDLAAAYAGCLPSNKAVREMEARLRELERQLGRKTLEVEILKEALDKSRSKKTDLACAVTQTGRFAMKTVAETLGVSRSNLHDRLNGSAKPRRSYHKAQDAAVLPRIERLVARRPTYGYRRIPEGGGSAIARRAESLASARVQLPYVLPFRRASCQFIAYVESG